MLFQKGEHIANYTVAFPHKQGAYAETYRVKDPAGKTRFLKLVNLSRLNRWQINDDGQIVEAEMLRQCRHHNLCPLVDSGTLIIRGGQYAYLVTEFVSGETLAERLVREKSSASTTSSKSPKPSSRHWISSTPCPCRLYTAKSPRKTSCSTWSADGKT